MTNGERLARIEAILERIDSKLDKVEADQLADIAELAKLKNKGSGILIGVAIAAGSLGASASHVLKWLSNLLT